MLNPVLRAVRVSYAFYFVKEEGNQASKTVLCKEIEMFVLFLLIEKITSGAPFY